MNSYQDRKIIETAIIIELLADPSAYIKVSEILSPQNFSEEKYRRIYKACSELYPNETISYLSVSVQSGLDLPDVMIDFIFDNRLSQSIAYNALVLVELSIREQFFLLTKKMLNENEAEEKRVDLQTLVAFASNGEEDIFKSIDEIEIYLKDKEHYLTEYEIIKKFNETIVKKVDKIKSGRQVKCLYEALDNLYHFDYQKQGLLSSLSRITRYVMANPVSPEIAKQIQTISTLL